jgi:hypothetical protein
MCYVIALVYCYVAAIGDSNFMLFHGAAGRLSLQHNISAGTVHTTVQLLEYFERSYDKCTTVMAHALQIILY